MEICTPNFVVVAICLNLNTVEPDCIVILKDDEPGQLVFRRISFVAKFTNPQLPSEPCRYNLSTVD